MKVNNYYYSLTKRGFDLVVSGLLLLLLSPVLIVVGLIVLVTAGRPIIYRQKRYGRDRRVFRILKFRVMYPGAEKQQWRYQEGNVAPTPMYKNWRDPRFVGIGAWLSKSGLDELPQLINIFKGEMSLVGPRPLPLAEADQLAASWEFRYQVKPGIFSEWSLSPQRHHSLHQWRQLEKKTLKQGGVSYDLTTIVNTLRQVIGVG